MKTTGSVITEVYITTPINCFGKISHINSMTCPIENLSIPEYIISLKIQNYFSEIKS